MIKLQRDSQYQMSHIDCSYRPATSRSEKELIAALKRRGYFPMFDEENQMEIIDDSIKNLHIFACTDDTETKTLIFICIDDDPGNMMFIGKLRYVGVGNVSAITSVINKWANK